MQPLPDRRVFHLATNDLSCLFETDAGFLRRIKRGQTEIIRAIYAAVRDENSNTIEPHLGVQHIRSEDNGFRVDFEARCEAPGLCFCWSGAIEARGPNLSFLFQGEVRSSFRKNRIGFCILHPIRECAGLAYAIQNRQSEWSEAIFSRFVSSRQPSKDLRRLRWSPHPGIAAELHFQGDVFETEDQRNWTDASFKTYCTPLAARFPVLIEAGAQIDQQVTLNLQSKEPIRQVEQQIPEIRLDLAEAENPVPLLGLEVASHGKRLGEIHLERLKKLKLSHLRVDLRLSHDGWLNRYRLAVEEANGFSALGLCDRNGSKRYLLANLEAGSKRVRCRLPTDATELRLLDQTNVDALRRGNLPKAEHYSLVQGGLDFNFPGTSLALIR